MYVRGKRSQKGSTHSSSALQQRRTDGQRHTRETTETGACDYTARSWKGRRNEKGLIMHSIGIKQWGQFVDILTTCGIGIKNHRELNTKHRIQRSMKNIRWSSRDARIFLRGLHLAALCWVGWWWHVMSTCWPGTSREVSYVNSVLCFCVAPHPHHDTLVSIFTAKSGARKTSGAQPDISCQEGRAAVAAAAAAAATWVSRVLRTAYNYMLCGRRLRVVRSRSITLEWSY